MGEALDDSTVGGEVKAKLLNRSAERFAEVDVEVAQGLVLLSGRVNSPEDRVEAEGIAWSSSRTEDVANEIRIEGPGGFLANVADELISARVRSRLLGSRTVKAVNYNIETYDGVVYLMGIARSAKELKKAAEEASIVSGVAQVVSYVRIQGEVERPLAPTTQKAPPYQNELEGAYDAGAVPNTEGVSY